VYSDKILFVFFKQHINYKYLYNIFPVSNFWRASLAESYLHIHKIYLAQTHLACSLGDLLFTSLCKAGLDQYVFSKVPHD